MANPFQIINESDQKNFNPELYFPERKLRSAVDTTQHPQEKTNRKFRTRADGVMTAITFSENSTKTWATMTSVPTRTCANAGQKFVAKGLAAA